jgi:small subunit ribosomal protein S17e
MTVDPNDVMSIGNRLLEQYPDTFTNEFNRDKEAVQTLTNVNSVHLRNRIAGYITRQKQ